MPLVSSDRNKNLNKGRLLAQFPLRRGDPAIASAASKKTNVVPGVNNPKERIFGHHYPSPDVAGSRSNNRCRHCRGHCRGSFQLEHADTRGCSASSSGGCSHISGNGAISGDDVVLADPDVEIRVRRSHKKKL